MKVLCPNCHSSVAIVDGSAIFSCDACGMETNLSSIGTSPGVAPVRVARDLSGEDLGGYRIEKLVGVGGMGVVYRASRIEDGQVVAVKVLGGELQWKRDEFVERFRREARALARLDHPGIVRILDSGQDEGVYFLVTEFVEGINLAQYLRSAQPTAAEIVDIMVQVCEAIDYAHANGVVHRDIKPANVLISDGKAKVVDFGLAQMTGGDTQLTTLTRTDLAMGTFNYLSPEQRVSARDVDERSDVFSLGVVFFEMLTGTLPVGNFRPPSALRPDLGRRFDKIVSRSLAADRGGRYASVGSMAGELRGLVAQRRGPNPGILVAAAAVFLVAGASVAYMFIPPSSREIVSPEIEIPDGEAQQIQVKSDVANQKKAGTLEQQAAVQQEGPAQVEQVVTEEAPEPPVVSPPIENLVKDVEKPVKKAKKKTKSTGTKRGRSKYEELLAKKKKKKKGWSSEDADPWSKKKEPVKPTKGKGGSSKTESPLDDLLEDDAPPAEESPKKTKSKKSK